ncbi:MAG: response regulator [Duncaniella sp.]|nr:response regulator [Duncaniella sp.]
MGEFIDDIRSLQQDADGNIWVKSAENYAVYNSLKDDFSTDIGKLLESYGVTVPQQYRIYVDREANLWVVTDKKISVYDMKTRTLRSIETGISLLGNEINIADNQAGIYLLLQSGKILRIDKETLSIESLSAPEGIKSFNHIYADYQQGLWLFSDYDNDIYYRQKSAPWNKISLTPATGAQSKGIRSILDDRNGHVWIGTDHNGAYIFDQSDGSFQTLRSNLLSSSSLPSDNVSCIYQDESGTIWLGHNKSGISYYNNDLLQFENFSLCRGLDVASLLTDSRNNLWIGTDGNGLLILRPGSETIERMPAVFNGSIISLEEDSDGRIWVGSYGNGLYCIDGNNVRHFTTANSSLISDIIWALQNDGAGNIWIATLNGTQYVSGKTDNFISVLTAKGEQINSMCLHSDNSDTVYIGSFDGLYKVDTATKKASVHFTNRRNTQSLKQGFVSQIYKDREGRLWVGHNQGLTIWDTARDSMYYLDKKSGLCDNMIRAILEDNDGHIYASTSNGLSIITVLESADGVLSYSMRNYTKKDGLKSTFFNSTAVTCPDSSSILFGTSDGCISFYPEKVFRDRRMPPDILFTDLYIGGTRIGIDSLYEDRLILKNALEATKQIELSYDDRLITIEFTACDLTGQSGVRYAYMLEGIDSKWIFSDENKVTFTSLPYGNYRLLVKSGLPNGNWKEDPAILEIRVRPPFYMSIWACIIYLFIIIGGVILVTALIRRRHRQKLAIQRQTIESQQIVRVNELKLKFFTNISHDLRTPLTLIMAPLQVLLDEVKDEPTRKKLLTIFSNARRLLDLINTLLDFRKLDVGAEGLHCRRDDIMRFISEQCALFTDYAANRGMNFTAECDPSGYMMDFDSTKVGKILNNLLSNAFKYTPDGGNVSVKATLKNGELIIRIADSGQGITPEAKKHIFERFYQGEQGNHKTGSGIGLHIANEYARMHGGGITVSDNHPKGSVFTLTLPVDGCSAQSNPEKNSGDSGGTPAEPSAPENISEESSAANSPATILIVDDNEEYRDFIADTLSKDYTIFKAGNGREALDIMAKENISLIVSDVMMPVMDGMELCRQVKTNIRWSHIPVILLTAKTAEEYRLEGLELGADDYLTKPFNLKLLQLRIKKFIDLFERNHRMFSNKLDVSPSEITITSLDEKLVEKAIRIVEEHMSDSDFSVELLSSELALSRGYLYKKLMAITGKGPAEFIRTIRLKRARQLLEQSQMQVAEIAYMCGFNSPRRFAQNFKNEFGMLPSEFLKGRT